MKKSIYGLVVLMTTTGMAVNAHGADGNISITAELFIPACNLTADSKTLTVPLGTVQRSELSTAGAFSKAVPFTLKFTDCAIGTGVRVSFMGVAASNDDTVFALDNPSQVAAQAVALQITDTWDHVVVPNRTWNSWTTANAADFSRNYTARYKALGNNVEPGEANVMVEYNVIYE